MTLHAKATLTLTPEGKDLLQNMFQELVELPVEFLEDLEPGSIYPHPTKPDWCASHDPESYNAVKDAWNHSPSQ